MTIASGTDSRIEKSVATGRTCPAGERTTTHSRDSDPNGPGTGAAAPSGQGRAPAGLAALGRGGPGGCPSGAKQAAGSADIAIGGPAPDTPGRAALARASD